MANVRYDNFAQYITTGNVFSWGSNTIQAALVSNTYTFSQTHTVLTDLGANRIGTDQELGGKTAVGGKLTSNAVTWTAVVSGNVKYVVLYMNTGVAGTSPLILCDDTAGGVGLPFIANGSDVTYTPDGTNGWIKI